jgi:hypothetical protein
VIKIETPEASVSGVFNFGGNFAVGSLPWLCAVVAAVFGMADKLSFLKAGLMAIERGFTPQPLRVHKPRGRLRRAPESGSGSISGKPSLRG